MPCSRVEVEVHFLTKSAFVDAVDGLEGVHKVWSIEKTTAEVELDLVELGFHYVVDLHANARSGFIKRALRNNGTLDLTVDKKSIEKILLVRFGWDRLRGEHVVERYLAPLFHLVMRFRPLVAEEMLVHWQCLLTKGASEGCQHAAAG